MITCLYSLSIVTPSLHVFIIQSGSSIAWSAVSVYLRVVRLSARDQVSLTWCEVVLCWWRRRILLVRWWEVGWSKVPCIELLRAVVTGDVIACYRRCVRSDVRIQSTVWLVYCGRRLLRFIHQSDDVRCYWTTVNLLDVISYNNLNINNKTIFDCIFPSSMWRNIFVLEWKCSVHARRIRTGVKVSSSY